MEITSKVVIQYDEIRSVRSSRFVERQITLCGLKKLLIMGISLKFKGSLDDTSKISKIRCELKNLATTLKWDHKEWNDDWAKPCDARLEFIDGKRKIAGHFSLKGATLVVGEKSEAIPILFDAHGSLCSPLQILNKNTSPPAEPVGVTLKDTRSDNFIWLMGLLKYLKKNYISDLEVSDDLDFWNTGDRQKLEQLLPAGQSSVSLYTVDQVASKLETMFKVMQN